MVECVSATSYLLVALCASSSSSSSLLLVVEIFRATSSLDSPWSSFKKRARRPTPRTNYFKWCANLIRCEVLQQLSQVLHDAASDVRENPMDDPALRGLLAQPSLLCLSMLFRVTRTVLSLDSNFSCEKKHRCVTAPLFEQRVLVAMVDIDTMVPDLVDLLMHVIGRRDDRREPAARRDGHGREGPAAERRHEQNILLTLDVGLSLLTSLMLSCDDDEASKHCRTMERLLDSALVQCESESVRRVAAVNFRRICHLPTVSEILAGRRFFDRIVRERRRCLVSSSTIPGLLRTTRNVQRSTEYFDVLCASLDKSTAKNSLPSTMTSDAVSSILLEQECTETFGSKDDDIFVGLCRILYVVLAREIQEGGESEVGALSPVLVDKLAEHLWSTCLFPRGALESGLSMRPETRKGCFMVLSLLPFRTRRKNQQWSEESSVRLHNWSYDPAENTIESNSGFVGLQNQGATCYMNSMLQQLYHIPSFRHGILRARSTSSDEDDDEKEEERKESHSSTLLALNMLKQLQVLFGYMTLSSHSHYDTLPLCYTMFDVVNGTPLRLTEQKDVNEFCSYLFDELERACPETCEVVKKHFQGTFVHEIISQDQQAPYTSTRHEPFYMITVPVKNKTSLEEGLELLTSGESLAGDNQYRLPSEAGYGENRKVNATKVMTVSELPRHLILHLKRFDFDYQTMEKSKINDQFTFPATMDMYRFTQRGRKRISEEERGAQHSREQQRNQVGKVDKEEVVVVETGDRKESDGEMKEATSNERGGRGGGGTGTTKYRLRGVVAHTGTADSGHYYSFINAAPRSTDPSERKSMRSSSPRVSLEPRANDGSGTTQVIIIFLEGIFFSDSRDLSNIFLIFFFLFHLLFFFAGIQLVRIQ